MPKADCFVSVVAPIRDDAPIVGMFIVEALGVLRENYLNYELVLVDDRSDDDTVAIVSAHLRQFECIRLIRLSRSFGQDIAIAAGLDSVIGDVVVVMLPQTDPTDLIPDIVSRTRRGAGIVFGIHTPRSADGWWIRTGSAVFYWYCRRVLRLNLPRNAAIFRGLSREAVNALIQIRDRCRYLPILSAHVGYDTESFVYQPVRRGSRSKPRSMAESANLAIDIMTTTSRHPLRFVTWLGTFAGLVNGAYTVYIIAVYLFKARVAEGWTTLSLQNAAMFFFVFLILTVLSEYVGHILTQSEDRPLYYALEERNSVVRLADEDRTNVATQSVDASSAIG